MKRAAVLPSVIAIWLFTTAHVGNPNAFFDGQAGPYSVSVTVRMPTVIPGEAAVMVRAADVRRVAVRPVRWDAGLDGAPPPETAAALPESPGVFAAKLWIMTPGSYYIEVSAAGEAGSGVVYVPVAAVSTTRIGLPPGRAALLVVLALLLTASGVAIAGSAARDALRRPGVPPMPADERRRRVGYAAASCILLAAYAGGARWWASMDAAHRESLFRPYVLSARVAPAGAALVLHLTIDDERWMNEQWTPLIPDHGKAMHVFLVREDLRALAHLHPAVGDDGRTFAAAIPPLPAGAYRVYADITQESGFSQTLTATVALPALRHAARTYGAFPSDPDDSWHVDDRALRRGARLTIRNGPSPRVGREWTFTVDARDAAGQPVPLEPYMGMLGHAIVSRDDGGVFMHLHPSGSISMASQQAFVEREPVEPSAVDPHAEHGRPVASDVSFRFAFPQPGRYRLWLQVRSGGEVITDRFDLEVTAF